MSTWTDMKAVVDNTDAALGDALARLVALDAERRAAISGRDAALGELALVQAANAELAADDASDNARIAALSAEVTRLTARVAELEADAEPPVVVPPAPAGMRYGVSATPGSFNQGYLAQVAQSGAEVGYYYGQDPRWDQVAAVPDSHDLWMQTKATSKAAYVDMLASFPEHRTGRVFLHYFNEPEDQIERGDFTLAQWQQRTDWLYQAIAERGLDYVVPAVEIMYWDLIQTNKGTAGPARLVDNYLRPGVKAVGMSAYAEKKLDAAGHEVSTVDPVKMPATIAAWSTKTGLPVSVITGWAVATDLLKDPVTLANRVTWTRTAAANLEKAGAAHMMWFDIPWSNGDYRLSSDPNLLTAWRTLAGV